MQQLLPASAAPGLGSTPTNGRIADIDPSHRRRSPYDPLISDGRSGSRCPRMSPYPVGLIKRISGQTGMSLYGFVAAAVAVRRHTRTLSRGARWRYTVGRPAASVSDVEALQ